MGKSKVKRAMIWRKAEYVYFKTISVTMRALYSEFKNIYTIRLNSGEKFLLGKTHFSPYVIKGCKLKSPWVAYEWEAQVPK